MGFRRAQANDPLLNGCPFEAIGPPITIYEPIFSTFVAMNEGKLPVQMSDQDFDYAEELLEALGILHTSETDRQIAINEPLEGLLGKAFINSVLNDNTSNDGAIHAVFGNILGLLLVMVVKNHGSSGDPSTQVGFSYTRWWSDSRVRIFWYCYIYDIYTI
jgi:hypothetical protein